jgi:hypothetical protein
MMDRNITEKTFDWHLFLGALGIVITLGAMIFGCYLSLSTKISKIETVLILKGLAPTDLFSAKEAKGGK